MNVRIQWVYGGESGFWRSAEGRFEIAPIYIGCTTPVFYKVEDLLTGQSNMDDRCTGAKLWALRRAEKTVADFLGE